MPFRPVHCAARSRVRPMIADLLDAYAAWGRPAVVEPRTEPRLTMLLPGCMTRPHAWVIQYVPWRFVSMMREVLRGFAGSGRCPADAGAVDQHVHAPELGHGLVDDRVAGGGVGDVDRGDDGAP